MDLSKLSRVTLGHGLFRQSFQAMGTFCEITFRCESAKMATISEKSLAWVRKFEKDTPDICPIA